MKLFYQKHTPYLLDCVGICWQGARTTSTACDNLFYLQIFLFPLAHEINMAANKVAMKIILLTYSGRAILL